MDNQTDELWLIGTSGRRGTGVFLMNSLPPGLTVSWSAQAKNFGNEQLTKALIDDVTYQQCVVQGEQDNVSCYKWVPQELAGYPAVQAAAAACQPHECVKRCASYGCLCRNGICG